MKSSWNTHHASVSLFHVVSSTLLCHNTKQIFWKTVLVTDTATALSWLDMQKLKLGRFSQENIIFVGNCPRVITHYQTLHFIHEWIHKFFVTNNKQYYTTWTNIAVKSSFSCKSLSCCSLVTQGRFIWSKKKKYQQILRSKAVNVQALITNSIVYMRFSSQEFLTQVLTCAQARQSGTQRIMW